MVEAGTLLQNRYLINKQIGAGGMGTVYKAIDQRFNSLVAIKETLFDELNLQQAFEREAQLLNSLRHPALPHVIDYFAEGDRQYLVMEYFEGEDLSEILKRKRLFPVTDVLRWADDLLDALNYLHSQKTPVVHRDIKPQNLKLTTRGEIILLDFGLAKGKPGDDSQVSRANSIFGYSRNYAPLEQIQGTGTDVRSDIYSLGATLYHLLTGKPPIDALTRATTFVNNQTDPLIPADALNQQIPNSIVQVLRQALELNPDLRPQTAVQLREALQIAAKTSFGELDFNHGKTSASNDNLAATAFYPVASVTNAESSSPQRSIEIAIPATNQISENSLPQLNSFQSFGETNVQQPNSLKRFAGIAAAILLLGGGGVAAWYAANQSASNANARLSISNSAVNTASSNEKPTVSNSNTKTEIRNEEKTLNPKSNLNVVESKQSESVNKTAAIETPSDEPPTVAEEEEAPLPKAPPIIVKSAPPTETPKRAVVEDETDEAPPVPQHRKVDKNELDDSEQEEDDKPLRRKRNEEPPNEDRAERINRRERRERRVSINKRKQQKLPTLLGAP